MTKREKAEQVMSDLRKRCAKAACQIDEYSAQLKKLADEGRDNSHSYDRVYHEAYGYVIALIHAQIIPLGDKNKVFDYMGM